MLKILEKTENEIFHLCRARENRHLDWVFLGFPGVGKTTLAERVCRQSSHVLLRTEAIFQEEMQRRTETGFLLDQVFQRGQLPAPEHVTQLLLGRLERFSDRPFILENFPTNCTQLETLSPWLRRKDGDRQLAFVYFTANEKGLCERISHRRVCSRCGQVYNLRVPRLGSLLPFCETCGGSLRKNPQDSRVLVLERFRRFLCETPALLQRIAEMGFSFFRVEMHLS